MQTIGILSIGLLRHSTRIIKRCNILTKQNFSSSFQQCNEIPSNLIEERLAILLEAKFITLALWRTCLRCIKTIRPGNHHDEAEFRVREEGRLNNFDSTNVTFEMPVDRDDELSSRANYYYQWTLENIQQESDCLDRDPMMEANVERYLHLLREGEKRRKWILKDYKFDDPYSQSFDHKRLNLFEKRCHMYLKETYNLRGWSLKNEDSLNKSSDEDDDFFDDIDSDDEDEYS